MNLFGFGGKKGQKAKKSQKSKPREVWKGKSFALDDIITPSVFVSGGENSPEPFLIDLHTVPGLEIDLSQTDLLHELNTKTLELLTQPHTSLLDHPIMSDVLLDPSYQPLPFFDNLSVSTNSFTENTSLLHSSDVCSLDLPTSGTFTLPVFTPPDVDSPGPVLPFDPPSTNPAPKFNFKKSDQPLIGVIDTGFNAKNPDIDYGRVKLGRDLVDNDNNPLLADGEGSEHGTHVLGIISATDGNDIGIDGINDQAPVWLGRAIGSGKWAESLREFVDEFKASGQPNGVVNLSFDLTQTNLDGSVTTRYELTPQEREALEYARQNGVIVVVAAGNDGGTMSALGQASQEFDNIITVGSVDFNKQKTEYSNFGYGLDLMAYGGTAQQPIISTMGDGADIDDEPPEDEMSANAKSAFNEVFGSFSDRTLKDLETDQQQLENLTPEERQVYEQATKDIDQLLQDYVSAASQKIALEYVDGYYHASVDALDKFVDAFDGDLGNTLLKAQEILDDAGISTDTTSQANESNTNFSIPLDLGVGEMAGTSVAAAKVTGVVSQVWAANPDLSYQQVKEILKQTAVDLNTPGWDTETGSGLVDIAAAVELAKNTQPQTYQPKPLVSPFTWGGEGQVTPGERAVAVSVPTFTGRVMNAGYVTTVGFLRIRSGPGTQYAEVGRKYPNEAVNFDAYENNGKWVDDPYMPGGGSSRWYKIAGTNNWMSALYIDNTPERAEEERCRQEQIRQAEEAARRAEEAARRAEEAARQAEEELRRLEEEARRQAEEQLRRILEETQRRQEQLQASLSYVTQKVGDLGEPLRSYINNGVAVYEYSKGRLSIQPDGRSAFYEVGKKVGEFFDVNQKDSFGNYVRNDYWNPDHPLLVNVANIASKAIEEADAIEEIGRFITYTGYLPGSNGFVLYPPRFGNYSKHVDNTLGFLAQQSRNWDEFIEGKTYTNPGKNGFVFKTEGALPKGTQWLGKASTIATIVGFVPTAWEYSQAETDEQRGQILISEGAEMLGGLAGGYIGATIFAPVFPPAGSIVGGIVGGLVGGYLGKKGGEWVADNWGSIRETTDNAWNAATSSVNAALEAVKQKAAEAKQKAQELANQAKAAYETTKANVEQAKAAYQNFKVEVQKATTQIVQQSQQKIKEVAQKVMNSVAQNPIVKAGSKVVNYVANYAQKAVKVVGNIINGAKQFVNNVIDTGKQIINNVIEQGKQAYENVKTFVTEKVEQGKQYVAETYKKVAESVNTVTNTISSGFNGVKSLFGW
ncbi:S8 family serine peptidase [Nostoc sp. ChiSLP03a]|uniref:S8 family serine peptidase n=1 Tax=Nostoc sp. ChiSLP03a TaxID=3075380 RepID=UPI002AD54D97|nr:S8 family serine peptidase [Nostoc sp. ChiSLP03a]MDZ8213354.1 S8 family serine peptidase [Nostoc sp. ChiSLP03a]